MVFVRKGRGRMERFPSSSFWLGSVGTLAPCETQRSEQTDGWDGM